MLEPNIIWSGKSLAEVPFRAYTDAQVYARELERIFYGPHWCYVGLAAEIPKPGDFKRTFVGERQVVMARDAGHMVTETLIRGMYDYWRRVMDI